MPRKVNYGVDRDEDYDIYDDYNEDYDYDYDYGIDGSGKSTELKRETASSKTKEDTASRNVWRCPICTFDNEESMSACDICGVLRHPLVKSNSNGQTNSVGGICRNSGASIMAKSLYASLPHRSPKEAVIFRKQKNGLLTEEDNKFHKHGNTQGQFHDLHKAFSFQNHYKVNIAPFKFDCPSPDDLVSMGMQSSKVGVKANFSKSSSSDTPSSIIVNNTNSESNAKKFNTSILISKDRVVAIEKNNRALTSEAEPQSLARDLKSMSMNVKAGSSKNVNEGKTVTRSQYKPEKWMLHDHSEDSLSQLNLAIVGHVDSGKSTLSGRLLHLLGRISEKEMHKYEKEAKQMGKGSFAYAWALDESVEERERGITMTVAVAFFNSKRYHVVLLDSPGHKDFVPNMISGATQADAAILVIDASLGSFEAGMDTIGGQTREHAQLIRSFGVDQIIVGINKMDSAEYSKERFDAIRNQVGTFLRSCGFKDSSILWIPLSAMENQNLVASASDVRLLSWYRGPCLLDGIDSLQPPTRDYSKPLVMPICDVIKSSSQGQVSACGKLEAGALRSGFKVLVLPSGDIGTVRSLERDSQPCSIARAGDNVAVCLQGVDVSRVMAGDVLCHPDFPVAVAKHFELKVLVLDVKTPILIGSQLEFHVHHAKEAAKVVKILSLLDPKTGKETKKSPRCLLAKQSAVLEVVLQSEVCVEEFSISKALGRVSLRSSGRTVAVGVITRIVTDGQN